MAETLNIPNLTFHLITDYISYDDGTEGNALGNINYGTFDIEEENVTSGTTRIKIKNAIDCATALNPICYLAGADSQQVSDEEWVWIKNISNNGMSVSDEYTHVSNSNTEDYKPLAGDIEGDSYVSFDSYVNIPAATPAGQYNWIYRIEYEYTV